MSVPHENTTGYELATWSRVEGTWQQLHGSFEARGVSVEWHDFHSEADLEWSQSFHPESIEICLNLAGTGTLRSGRGELTISDRGIALYQQSERLQAIRQPGDTHR